MLNDQFAQDQEKSRAAVSPRWRVSVCDRGDSVARDALISAIDATSGYCSPYGNKDPSKQAYRKGFDSDMRKDTEGMGWLSVSQFTKPYYRHLRDYFSRPEEPKNTL